MPIRKEVFIKNYIKALNNGDAAVFAGAGLSAPSGCVNWKQLLREIAEELQLDIEKESDLVAIAQYYYNKNGSNRTRLNDIIKDAFQTGKNPNVNHNILARLPVSTYWTTNYDKLIEKSLENNGKICDVKTCCANLTTTLKGRNVVVYKMHGDVDHPEEAVLIRDDYESYSQEKMPFINALSGDLMTKTFLFIGFSFTDPNFSYICAHLRTHLKGNMREHYCFLKDISRDDCEDESEFEYEKRKLLYFIDDLKRFNIKTVLIQEYSEITEMLRSIKRIYNSRTVYISGAAAEYEPDGKDAYEIAVCQGFEGTRDEWLQSLVGPRGPIGPRGVPGMSPYEAAKLEGYEGTAEELYQTLAKLGTEGGIANDHEDRITNCEESLQWILGM